MTRKQWKKDYGFYRMNKQSRTLWHVRPYLTPALFDACEYATWAFGVVGYVPCTPEYHLVQVKGRVATW